MNLVYPLLDQLYAVVFIDICRCGKGINIGGKNENQQNYYLNSILTDFHRLIS
jgi:hypothetical protein